MESSTTKDHSSKCLKDMICLEEAIYKCYKCLDREKDYVHITKLQEVLKPICLKIAEREVYGEKYDRFIGYSNLQQFTESQVKEIMNSQHVPDDQNPEICELRSIVKGQTIKINKLEEQIKTLLNFVTLIHIPQYLQIHARNLALEFAINQYSIDMLQQYEDHIIELWMLEYAARCKRYDVLDRLLKKYFKDIEVESMPYNQGGEECLACPVKIYAERIGHGQFQYQHLHIKYKDQQRLQYDQLQFDRGDYGPLRKEYWCKNQVLIYLINYHFKLNMDIVCTYYDRQCGTAIYEKADLNIKRFGDGWMVAVQQIQGKEQIYCEDSKLCLKLK